ncbi:hypothetical protein CXB51_015492 [Gossypium anomalum]|uniref:Endoplasmic reticulum transmembrane protein n=1 Tax=Gossypium anomalum TaxID=47600 RepID=A0A8J6CZD9_9ROSI|nr:hypothetical protein CXB51_015492 [Gossypium anomalum]
MAVIMVLSFKTPFRKLVIMGLDRLKRGRGPVVVKTVAGTVFVVMVSSVYSMMEIQKRWVGDDGPVSSTDQALCPSLLTPRGFQWESEIKSGIKAEHNTYHCWRLGWLPDELQFEDFSQRRATIFLALMIDRLHHYIRELRIRRKTMDAVKKQGQGSDDKKPDGFDKVKSLEEEVMTLREKLKQLESDIEAKTKQINAAEVNTVALRKQSEGLLLEYDRLLEENESLRVQLQSLDRKLSRSDSKKNL